MGCIGLALGPVICGVFLKVQSLSRVYLLVILLGIVSFILTYLLYVNLYNVKENEE